LSINDLHKDQILEIVDLGLGLEANELSDKPLDGMNIGIFFRGPSTRTRTAFTVAAQRLGADTIAYGPSDLQLSTGETIGDTARVLSGYLHGLVIRTNGDDQEMRDFSTQSEMSIINAMSASEHPTQVLGDLITLKENFGRLHDLHVLYLGEGNNTAASLALVLAKLPGNRITVVTPPGYGLKSAILEQAMAVADRTGSAVDHHHDLASLPTGVDAVYTTRWETMGVVHQRSDWREIFAPYKVTRTIMSRVSKPQGTIFLHDLPAIREADVEDEVLDGDQSLAFRQAFHKLTSAQAVLYWCIAKSSQAPS
jgi:ornithine carbamoyltransferase